MPRWYFTVRASTIKVQTELTASEAAVDFEDVVGGGVGTQEVALTYSGTSDLTIAGISAIGAAFSVSGANGYAPDARPKRCRRSEFRTEEARGGKPGN